MFDHLCGVRLDIRGKEEIVLLPAAGVAADDQENGLRGTDMVPKNHTTEEDALDLSATDIEGDLLPLGWGGTETRGCRQASTFPTGSSPCWFAQARGNW